ncbi:type 1 periplasmic binding fold superfamily protein [Psychroserpens luteolus]|uniref:type 1 periplasmic binding fold superfamily protein n=1 Tax=Psychroserpens luteolus TaxID=2855840 RepID=UPI001E471A29|nr:type 1 periplasmic binding fold superfamily protein [Psychroserpens luteolus]MCD2258996.1 type 1 periplasmic binding fold superfamily protein [Psychroserpens luteolus]
MKTIKILAFILCTSALITSCSNDDDNPPPVNEEEVITTLTATLTPVGGGTEITLQTRDLDGDGPNPPVITVSGPLAVGTTYNGSLELLNETETPAELINTEILGEDDEHQFFFQSTNSIATFTYSDTDGDGNPLGLEFTLTTAGSAGSGNITIILRHELDKNATGVSDGDITNAGGDTDIQTSFTVMLQ